MSVPAMVFGQAALGLMALGWTAFLLPRTGFLWWLAGNSAYSALAIVAAALHLRGHRAEAVGAAILGAVCFIASNGIVAIFACSTDGACVQIVTVAGVIAALQIAALAAGNDREHRSRR